MKFLNEFIVFGWDGGRTLGGALLAIVGVIYIPKAIALALYHYTLNEIWAYREEAASLSQSWGRRPRARRRPRTRP